MLLESAFLADLGVPQSRRARPTTLTIADAAYDQLPSSSRNSIDEDSTSRADVMSTQDPTSPSSPRHSRRWTKGLWGMLQRNPEEEPTSPKKNRTSISSARGSLNLSRTSTQETDSNNTPVAKRISVGFHRSLTKDSDRTIGGNAPKKGNFSFGKLLFGSGADESQDSKEKVVEESVLESLGRESLGDEETSLPSKLIPEFEKLPRLEDLPFPPPFPISEELRQLLQTNQEQVSADSSIVALTDGWFLQSFSQRQAISLLVEEAQSPIAFGACSSRGVNSINPPLPPSSSVPPTPKTPAPIGKGSSFSSASGVSAAQRSVSAASVDTTSSAQTGNASLAPSEESSKTKASHPTDLPPSIPIHAAKKTNVISNNTGHCETISFYGKFGSSSDVSLGQLIEEMTSWVSSSRLESDSKNGIGNDSDSIHLESKGQDRLGSLSSGRNTKGTLNSLNKSSRSPTKIVHYIHGDHRITISAKHLPSRDSSYNPSNAPASISSSNVGNGNRSTVSTPSRKDPSTIEAEIDAVAAVLQTDKGSARTAVEVAATAVNLAVQGQIGSHFESRGKDGKKTTSNSIWLTRANARDGKIGKGSFMSEATYMMSFAKVIQSLLFNKDLTSGSNLLLESSNQDDEIPSIQGQTLASIKNQLKTRFGSTPTNTTIDSTAQAADRYNIVTLFKSADVLVKISIRPIVLFDLIHGPAISSNPRPAILGTLGSGSQMSAATSNRDGSGEEKKAKDSTRLEIQKFFTDVKGHVSTLVSLSFACTTVSVSVLDYC